MNRLVCFLASTLAVISVTLAQERSPAVDGDLEYFSVVGQAGISRHDLVRADGAAFVAVHFAQFDLPEGDVVNVRSLDGSVSFSYTGHGRGNLGLSNRGFYADRIQGDGAIVEYFANAQSHRQPGQGYVIDSYLRDKQEGNAWLDSVCGKDDTLPVKCYMNNITMNLPKAYEKAQAVVRLTIVDFNYCTGFFLGPAGYLITNNHCVGDDYVSNYVDVEVRAESTSCEDQCMTEGGCKGNVIAKNATIVHTNETMDYTILKLPHGTDISPYGYLQFRASGPVKGEQIYIPQHPQGFAKRIASLDDNQKPTVVTSINVTNSCGTEQVGYMADTDHGASGAPVISAVDNLVVGLHYCGGCDNTAINVVKLLKEWKKHNIEIPGAVATEN